MSPGAFISRAGSPGADLNHKGEVSTVIDMKRSRRSVAERSGDADPCGRSHCRHKWQGIVAGERSKTLEGDKYLQFDLARTVNKLRDPESLRDRN